MIQLKERMIEEVPVLELVLSEKENDLLPTVVFYHGWTSTKEAVLREGYELAKRGFRAILPEAHLHGARDKSGKMEDLKEQQAFWKVIRQNVKELPPIFTYYVAKGLTDRERFGVAGLSMGGITTCAMLTQYDWIKSAVVLMGSPSPIPFTNWLLESQWMEDFDEEASLNPMSMIAIKAFLKPISLNEYSERIDGRHVHFWHGTEDELVPFHLTEEFIEQISMHPYAENVTFSPGHGVPHRVPYFIAVEMAEYFEKHL